MLKLNRDPCQKAKKRKKKPREYLKFVRQFINN